MVQRHTQPGFALHLHSQGVVVQAQISFWRSDVKGVEQLHGISALANSQGGVFDEPARILETPRHRPGNARCRGTPSMASTAFPFLLAYRFRGAPPAAPLWHSIHGERPLPDAALLRLNTTQRHRVFLPRHDRQSSCPAVVEQGSHFGLYLLKRDVLTCA